MKTKITTTTPTGSEVSPYVFVTVLLATLKLAGAITWSWWWVTAPVWLPVALTVAVTVGIIVAVLICGLAICGYSICLYVVNWVKEIFK